MELSPAGEERRIPPTVCNDNPNDPCAFSAEQVTQTRIQADLLTEEELRGDFG